MSRGPKRAKQWAIGGEFGATLNFDGTPILTLHEGAQRNLDNLPKLVASLNAAGVVFALPKPPKETKAEKFLKVGAVKLAEPTLEELERSCLGKVKMGENAARACALKYRQRAYACILCHGWHCTHLLPDMKVHG